MTTSPSKSLDLNPFSLICRGCLAEGCEMKNIYEWGLAEDFHIFSDVSMSTSEGMSEMLCDSCEALLVSFVRFRSRCQRSALILRERYKHPQKKELATLNFNTEQELHRVEIDDVLTQNSLTITISTLDMDSKIYLPCPYKCKYNAIKQKDLLNHLIKSHCVNERRFSIEVKFFCRIENCSYNKNSDKNKYFTGRKFLNQHINKVHRLKDIICEACLTKFSTHSDYQRHLKVCNVTYVCAICNITYKTNERLLVHLKRRHPDLHVQHKQIRKSAQNNLKRVSETVTQETKKSKKESTNDFLCDSPKRSFATQTFIPESNIRNDVALPSWTLKHERSEDIDRNFSTIETQTVFEDLLSLKSQNSEDDSLFFSENVSLSDIQTQTFPIEFGLSRKETITSETQTRNQSPDLSIKETQTCFCLFDSPKVNLKLFDSMNSSPSSEKTSTETQTAEFSKSSVKSDVLLSFNSAETQTCFDDNKKSKGF